MDIDDCSNSDRIIIERISGLRTLIDEKFDENAKEHTLLIVQNTVKEPSWRKMVMGSK